MMTWRHNQASFAGRGSLAQGFVCARPEAKTATVSIPANPPTNGLDSQEGSGHPG